MKTINYIIALSITGLLTSCFPDPGPAYRPQVLPQILPQVSPQVVPQVNLPNIPKIPSVPVLQNRPTKPALKRLENGHYRVLQDWAVTVNGRKFVVQKGYKSNGITAPKFIKRQLGDSINAPETWTAVFHDWLFTQKGISRQQADNYYIQLMRDFRINESKIRMMGNVVKGYSIYKGGN